MTLNARTKKARAARMAVRDATHAFLHFDHDDEQRGIVDAEGLRALGALDALRSETRDGADFQRALQDDVGFDKSGAGVVRATLEEAGGFQHTSMGRIASVPQEEATTLRLAQEHAAWMESDECLKALHRRPSRKSGSFTDGLDPDHEFAPFLEWLSRGDIANQVKAEAMARIDLYIRSGHAAADLSPQEQPDPNHSETVLRMREIAGRLRRQEPVPEREVAAILERRFEQLFSPIRVHKRDDCEQGTVPVAQEGKGMGFSLLQKDGGAVEGAGMIDAVIRDRDTPSLWHVATATSNDTPFSQRDQLPRHTAALLNAMDIGTPPFRQGDAIASLSFYAPAYMKTERRRWLGDTAPLTDQECEALNALQLYAQMGYRHTNRLQSELRAVLWAEHRLAGGRSAATGGIGQPIEALVGHAGEVLVNAVQALAHPERRIDQEKHGSGFVGPLFDLVIDSASALYDDFPRESEPYLRTLCPLFRQLGEQAKAAGASKLRNRFESLARDFETIDDERRNQVFPERRVLTEADVGPLLEASRRLNEREHDISMLVANSNHSPAAHVHAHLKAAGAQACDGLWKALVNGDVVLTTLIKAQFEGMPLLKQDEDGQLRWLEKQMERQPHPAFKERLEAIQEAVENGQFASNASSMNRYRQVARYGQQALFDAMMDGTLSAKRATEAHVEGVPVLRLDAEAQNAWAAMAKRERAERTPFEQREAAGHHPQIEELEARLGKRRLQSLSAITRNRFYTLAERAAPAVFDAVLAGDISVGRVVRAKFGETAVLDLPTRAQKRWLAEALPGTESSTSNRKQRRP